MQAIKDTLFGKADSADDAGGQEQKAGSTAAVSESYSYSTSGEAGRSTAGRQMSALPGHGTGEPKGQVTEGTAKTHPIGRTTGTAGRPTTAHNTHVGSGNNQGYGTGGSYSG